MLADPCGEDQRVDPAHAGRQPCDLARDTQAKEVDRLRRLRARAGHQLAAVSLEPRHAEKAAFTVEHGLDLFQALAHFAHQVQDHARIQRTGPRRHRDAIQR